MDVKKMKAALNELDASPATLVMGKYYLKLLIFITRDLV